MTNQGTTGVLSCAKFIVTGHLTTTELTQSGYYPNGTLFVTKIRDEENIDEANSVSYEFKDNQDRVILTRQINNSVNYDTYYVYDDLGNLCYVLPPECSDLIVDKGVTKEKLEIWGYMYYYDVRNRCIMKKLPGCDRIHYVYDKADRLILSQDGEQLNKKTYEAEVVQGRWSVNLYDDLGRLVMTGESENARILPEEYNGIVKCEYSNYWPYHFGYRTYGVGFTWNYYDIHTVKFYDNYDFLQRSEFTAEGYDKNLAYDALTGYNTGYGTGGGDKVKAKGLLTGTVTAVLDPTTNKKNYIYTAFYYDERGRMIQSRSTNHLGGMDYEYFKYNFTGDIVEKLHIHNVKNNTPITTTYKYDYDYAGRLLKTTNRTSNSSQGEVTLAVNTYDNQNRLETTTVNNQSNLKTSYSYNIRSWITKIDNNLFTEDLYYEQQVTGHGNGKAKPYYDGNISVMEWYSKVGSDYDKKLRSYWFFYDSLLRLVFTSYRENVATGDRVENNRFQTIYTYDKQGNLKTLSKRGLRAGGDAFDYIDRLTVRKSIGNQIMAVDDKGVKSYANSSYDFNDRNEKNKKDPSYTEMDYAYNRNGAMSKNLNKGIDTIKYNLFNLPQQIDILHAQAEARNEYTYSATGSKLQVVTKWNSAPSNMPIIGTDLVRPEKLNKKRTTDYVGNFIYENGILDKTLIEGGYINGGKYYFYIKDHLGNNRVVADASGNVIQRTHYYPFGAPFNESTGQEVQAYKFGDKEFDTMHGLNQYDFDARQQDPTLAGRFTTVDPMAEKYYSWSPYVYCLNNPIKNIDPDGKQVFPSIGNFQQAATNHIIQEEIKKAAPDIQRNAVLGIATMTDLNDVTVLATAIASGGDAAINIDGTPASTWDRIAAVGGLVVPVASGSLLKKAGKEVVGAVKDVVFSSSKSARREVMKKAGIPTSQPLIPDKLTKSNDKVFVTRDKAHTIQDAKNDVSHKGEPHWEAGPTKKDPNSFDGLNRSGNNNKPQMAKPKFKVRYNEK